MSTIVQYTISSTAVQIVNNAPIEVQLSGTLLVEYSADKYTYVGGALTANNYVYEDGVRTDELITLGSGEATIYEPKILGFSLSATNADVGYESTVAGDYTSVGSIFFELRVGSSSGINDNSSNTFFLQAGSFAGPYYGLSFTDADLDGIVSSAYNPQAGQNWFRDPNYPGTYFNGETYVNVDAIVVNDVTTYSTSIVTDSEDLAMPAEAGYIDTSGDFAVCFTPDTLISTPTGSTPVQHLTIGDLILNHAGQSVPVKWIGTQRIHPAFIGDSLPICIRAGALGNSLPFRDLFVSPHHAMYIDHCLLIEAKALINGATITQVTQWQGDIEYLHIETEHHEIILAEGAPAETFIDNVSRARFNNYSEYQALYPEAHEMTELDLPRVSHRRQLPNEVKKRLGEVAEVLVGKVKVQIVA